ncbi:MAG: ROK family protein [Lachnospiraceae bacterium]|nr:ROK family protein [Lachnospiraceae bacterium]
MIDEYRDWIRVQNYTLGTLSEKDGNFRVDSDFALAEINFYELEMTIVELRITRKKDDETVFFLHFELRDMEYAKELFVEMGETYAELSKKQSVQVLLSCTSALTTGLVADKLNQAASLLSADFHFDAVPFPELYEKAPDYDLLLLAPQIAYEGAKIRKIMKDMTVLDIPPRLFATYDAPAILELVRQKFAERDNATRGQIEKKTVSVSDNTFRILSIAVLGYGKDLYRVLYRCYDNGKPDFEERVMRRGKGKNLHRILRDIIETSQGMHKCFDAIGITMPGEVRNGHVAINHMDPELDLVADFEKRYGVPIILKNNTQAGILGFHARHSHYKSAALLSQGVAARFGGCGAIVNNQLLEGAHNVAGEIKYILRRFYGLTISETHGVTPAETLETLDLFSRCIISLLDPEILLVRSKLLTDIEDLHKALLRTIPAANLPKLRKIDDNDALEYMLLGIMTLCVERLVK